MKREPTEVVALAIHGFAVLVSALMWFSAHKIYARDLEDFRGALPAGTEFVYDFHVPAVLCVALSASLTAALFLRGHAALIVSLSSVGVAVPAFGVIWWMLRLPYLT